MEHINNILFHMPVPANKQHKSKYYPMAYGPGRFNTAFTRALQYSLFWAESIQFLELINISINAILILSSHLRLDLPKGRFPVGLTCHCRSKLSIEFRGLAWCFWTNMVLQCEIVNLTQNPQTGGLLLVGCPTTSISNSMAYGAQRFNATFSRALQ